ncbi:MAG: tRNA pseudouridine(55) synthase TruB [Myxococcota bacterium]|nr:tRNA pseudouridine(55) synthase TruB [Myxococcota bacterium]
MVDGVLVIDKHAGPTSHDVVDSVRKILKMRKVGHTGTLDPAATGVLPIVLGKGTKLSRYLTGNNKSYRGTITLGVTTETLDAEGEVVEERPVDVDQEAIIAAVEKFRGEIDQVPPMFSAKKMDGKRLYQLAREGIEVEREAKKVTIFDLTIVEIDLPHVVVDVTCSAGTYIRVLAEDIGSELGCGAHLSALRRTESGVFSLKSAITLDELADDPEAGLARLVPLSQALESLPKIQIPTALAMMIGNGYQLTAGDLRTVDLPDFGVDDALALGTGVGDVIAVVRSLVASDAVEDTRRDERAMKTEKVFER